MPAYSTVIVVSWAVFLLVWIAFAFFVKRDVRGGRSMPMRILIASAIAVFVMRRARPAGQGSDFFSGRLAVFTPPVGVAWLGAILTAIGIAIAIWARLYIGRNWSPRPAVKEQHELVTNGPYSFVRHPIYSGITLATFGTALTGSVFGMLVFVFAVGLFLSRVKREERIMLELFPNAYPSYQTHTKRLIPFVW